MYLLKIHCKDSPKFFFGFLRVHDICAVSKVNLTERFEVKGKKRMGIQRNGDDSKVFDSMN